MKIYRYGIIVFCIACLLFLVVAGGSTIHRYSRAKSLCDQIRAGEEIDTNFSNGVTAPRFFDKIATILQIEGPKIPLVEACYYRNVQAVTTLLKNGADPNTYLEGRWTPLQAAIVNGTVTEESWQIVRLLLENGADPDAYASDAPLIMQLGSRMVSRPLNEWEEQIFYMLLDAGANGTKSDGTNLVFYAARGGHPAMIKGLVEKYRFNVNAKGYEGQTPLIFAVSIPGRQINKETIEVLLSLGAQKDKVDDTGKTAFDYATENGYENLVELLK